MSEQSKSPKWRQCLEEGDLPGCLGRIILDIGYVFMYFWLACAVVIVAFTIWAAYIADPSVMSPDSLNRDSPTTEKIAHIVSTVFLVAFGVLWLFLVRFLRRRLYGSRS
jgi:lysylphosphatidylglycerol synthetase-like protein (DUF2156 family)